ncbi:MAG: protein-export chaperone SecB [Microscillaceae bacterium]|jgi:preprotein translocase subunit SecB|nr:protein-export chaperone SecB [Microscillaceae bacterium]
MSVKINLLQSQVLKLTFDRIEQNVKGEHKIFNLDYAISYDSKDVHIFSIIFQAQIYHPKEFVLELAFSSWFRTSEAITDDFKNSNYPNINAPAIAYPFLRVFIANFTLNAGFQPAMIPVINFFEEYNKKSNT